MRDECKCNYCKKKFSCSSKVGTNHLNRHINDRLCPVYKPEPKDKSQSLLCYLKGDSEQDNSVIPWKFDQECSMHDLTEFIIYRELPFNLVEDPSFRKFVWGIYPKLSFSQ